MPSTTIYPSALRMLQNGTLDLDTDTLKLALVTSSYTYSSAHDYFNDITNEVANGNGYTSGGATVGSVTLTTTLANSWATTWGTGTAYTLGQLVIPSTPNTYIYQCVVAGTSHAATEPTWTTTKGVNNTDNTVTWLNVGKSVTVFDFADVSWAASTITARGAVLYEDTGDTATSALICFLDFDSDVTSTAATFTVTVPSIGLLIAAA